MATNPASYNPIGEETGPATEPPPPVSESTKAAIANAAESSATGSHIPGQDAPPKLKTEKELEKERKKAEKQAKFDQKKAKVAAASSTSKTAAKKAIAGKKAQEEELPPYVEDTPPGEKKILKPFDDPYSKAYHPIAIESGWNSWWEKKGFFKPEFTANGKVKPEGSFVIPLPPPNVTGALHMGHALGNSLQDILIRWNRMQGKTTLWIPGCDHAGIATQGVVEKMLANIEGKTRHDLGRAEFLKRCWEWKDDYHKRINNAQRRMGSSLDWTREAFTMNETFTAAVTKTFVKLHEEGLIYRDFRLAHWDTDKATALSDLEIVNKELKGSTMLKVPGYDKPIEFGVIHYFKYEIEDSDEKIEIATTRIETMLGDSGIAVHPKNTRWAHLLGKNAIHPFIEGRLMPIIADEYADIEKGTGAVKLTPAHSHDDYKLGKEHNLEFINILTDDGKLNENAGPYVGRKRFDVRETIIHDLTKRGLYMYKKDNEMQLPISERSNDIIEPLLRPQWYMKMKDMAADALKAVTSGQIKIIPEQAEKRYIAWMSDVNDWCLSRQLWWGHQAPMYLAHIDGEERSDGATGKLWFSGRTPEEAEKKAKASKDLTGKTFKLERDPDVLDTWFSAGLWPMATLGWPNTEAPDFEKLFPTSLLETGIDILFFWVARMIMFSLKLTDKVPFTEVYCHSIIRDSENRKMSKSLGNVIDPLDLIEGISLQALHDKLSKGNLAKEEIGRATKFQKTAFPDGIPECGTDALRFALAAYSGGGDIAFDIKVIHGYRKFCNKIYQATKFVLGNLPTDFVPRSTGALTGKESLAERWILHNFTICAKEVNQNLEAREFSKATSGLYQYFLNQLCDVYIENSKAIIREGTEDEKRSALETLYTALEGGLTLMHPFMPFITEELWQRVPRRPEDETPSIMKVKYPTYNTEMDDPTSEAAYDLVLGISKGIRSLIAMYTPGADTAVYIHPHTAAAHSTATNEAKAIKSLIGKGTSVPKILSITDSRPSGCILFTVSSAASVMLHVKGHIDIDAEISKGSRKLEEVKAKLEKLRKVQGDPKYLEKATETEQEAGRDRLLELEAEDNGFTETIKQLEDMKMD